MNTPLNPTTVCKPLAAYSQTVSVPADAQWVVIAGQIGVNRNGKLASGIRKQAEQALRNVVACARAGGMQKRDLVKITIYLTDPRFVSEFRVARKKILGDDIVPTSTMLIVQGLASPDMLVEVEAWAAK